MKLPVPTRAGIFYWVERSQEMSIFLGPISSLEEAIQAAKAWKSEGGILTPEHMSIFLIFSRGEGNTIVWDLVKPVQTFGKLFF